MSAGLPAPATVGAVTDTRTYAVTRADLLAYAEASGDDNPIHQDETVALAVGLPGVIAHGMYTMGLMAHAIREWFPTAEVREIGSKFTSPVVVPAEGSVEIEVSATVKKVEDDPDDPTRTLVSLTLVVACEGAKVLGMPKALLAVPRG